MLTKNGGKKGKKKEEIGMDFLKACGNKSAKV